MKKSKVKWIAIIVAITLILSSSSFGVYHFFYDTQAIEPKQYLSDSVSPKGEYKICAYIDNGNATNGSSILCVLYKTHDDKYSRNIYWNKDCDSAEIKWLSETSVIINDIKLDNATIDKYDWRYQ